MKKLLIILVFVCTNLNANTKEIIDILAVKEISIENFVDIFDTNIDESNLISFEESPQTVYTTWNIKILQQGNKLYHIADYKDSNIRVVTLLNGSMKGFQTIGYIGSTKIIATSDDFEWFAADFFVHHYSNRRVATHKDFQMISFE